MFILRYFKINFFLYNTKINFNYKYFTQQNLIYTSIFIIHKNLLIKNMKSFSIFEKYNSFVSKITLLFSYSTFNIFRIIAYIFSLSSMTFISLFYYQYCYNYDIYVSIIFIQIKRCFIFINTFMIE